MHGILHMEQNFKGEYSSLSFHVRPLLIQAGLVCWFVLLFAFSFFFLKQTTNASPQSKPTPPLFSQAY